MITPLIPIPGKQLDITTEKQIIIINLIDIITNTISLTGSPEIFTGRSHQTATKELKLFS